jgi:hypothetical protein
MPAHCTRPISHSYYAVFIDYGRKGLEAIVDPEVTRRGIVDRIRSGEYKSISFIHHIEGGHAFDCTDELMNDAGVSLEAAE